MSCNACSAIIDCADFGGIVGDLAPSNGFFATQDYSFLLDCPTGYFCFPGYYPRIITIPRGSIPEITIGDGGQISILGCESMVTGRIPVGATATQVQIIVGQVFAAWARQAANCANINTGPRPGIPPPTLIPTGKGSKIELENEEQCVTAKCTPESAGDPRTDCVEAGAWELTLFDATASQIAAAQAHLNASALKEATDGAQALLRCGVCNTRQEGSMFCPGNPGLNSHVIVEAGKYCLIGGDQFLQDSKAQADMINQLAALQNGLGCVCTVSVNYAARTITTTCPLQFNVVNSVSGNPISPPSSIVINGTLDFGAFYNGITSSCPGHCCFVPATFTGPIFCLPYGFTSPGVCTS